MSPNPGRKPGVPDSLIRQRIRHAVQLKIEGYSQQTILAKINAMDRTKGWGSITQRQLKRDFQAYYEGTSLQGVDAKMHSRAMRELLLEDLELQMEKFSEHVKTKKNWRPFEYEQAMKMLFEMKKHYIEIQNWNISKHKDRMMTQELKTENTNQLIGEASDIGLTMDPEIRNALFVEPLEAMMEHNEGASPQVVQANQKALMNYFRTLAKNKEEF